jgi:hypothetical protein
MTSVPLFFIDDREQLQQLVDSARSEAEVGLATVCHPHPLTLSVLAISFRECEYLIDCAEIPTAVEDLAPLLTDPRVTKVVSSAAQTCQDLHSFGAAMFVNVFCVRTASLFLGKAISLEEQTLSFRTRLNEKWRAHGPVPLPAPVLTAKRCSTVLSTLLQHFESSAMPDWRLRPLSLDQMNVAGQEVHYLLYLYDSLRLYLKKAPTPDLLRTAFRISHQKASMRWDRFRSVLQCPNALILSSLYRQPLPHAETYQRLMLAKQEHPDLLRDVHALWLSLAVPRTPAEVGRAITACAPPPELPFAKPQFVDEKVAEFVLSALRDAPDAIGPDDVASAPQTIDDIVTELGWVPRDESTEARVQVAPDCALVTGISPRLAVKSDRAREPGAGNLRHLMNPDQPTIVSRQIEGIPNTEAQIYQLANELRMRQKLQGKVKVKPQPVKEDAILDDDPETVLHNLVSVGYIDEQQEKKIRIEAGGGGGGRPEGTQRRAHSEDKTTNPPRRASGGPTLFAVRDRKRP